MKAIYYNLILLLVFPAIVMATPNNHDKNWKGKYTKEKKIKKEYDVNSDATLNIQNDYGNLELTTWNENRIVIEVIIKTNGDDEEKVQEKLNDITVDFSGTSNLVTARTRFSKDNGSSNWWSSWTSGGRNNVNKEVNYIVKLPATNNVDLDNDYGGISIDVLQGRAKIDCDYGKITIGELMAEDNYITFDYSSGCTFDYIKSAVIDADYSGYTIEEVENIKIDTDYTSGKIIKAKNVEYNSDYGGLEVMTVNNIKGDGDYFSLKLGDVYGNVQINADYGSIKVDTVKKGAGNIDLEGDYTGIKLGYDAAYEFTFDIDLSYAGFSGTDGLEFTLQDKSSYSKRYAGYNGSKNAKNRVRISSDYGGVKMFRQ